MAHTQLGGAFLVRFNSITAIVERRTCRMSLTGSELSDGRSATLSISQTPAASLRLQHCRRINHQTSDRDEERETILESWEKERKRECMLYYENILCRTHSSTSEIWLVEASFKNSLYKYITEHWLNCILKAVCADLWMLVSVCTPF